MTPKVYIEIKENGQLAVSWMDAKNEFEVLNVLGAAIEAVKERINNRAIVTPVKKAPFEIVPRGIV